MIRVKTVFALAALTLLPAAPAFAHHSFAMFDSSKKITLVGTVKEFQWTNPHSWIQVMVPDENGKLQEWGVEGSSPTSLVRQGWTRRSLSKGDKVTLVVNPLRSGEKGGNLITATLADGTVLGRAP